MKMRGVVVWSCVACWTAASVLVQCLCLFVVIKHARVRRWADGVASVDVGRYRAVPEDAGGMEWAVASLVLGFIVPIGTIAAMRNLASVGWGTDAVPSDKQMAWMHAYVAAPHSISIPLPFWSDVFQKMPRGAIIMLSCVFTGVGACALFERRHEF